MPMNKYKIAVLDDYQNVALESADWSVLRDGAEIAVFHDHLADPDAVVERLLPFDVVCVMRERTPLPRLGSMAAILLVFLLPLVERLAGHFQVRHLLAFGWIALAVAMYFSCKHIDLLISFRSAA